MHTQTRTQRHMQTRTHGHTHAHRDTRVHTLHAHTSTHVRAQMCRRTHAHTHTYMRPHVFPRPSAPFRPGANKEATTEKDQTCLARVAQARPRRLLSWLCPGPAAVLRSASGFRPGIWLPPPFVSLKTAAKQGRGASKCKGARSSAQLQQSQPLPGQQHWLAQRGILGAHGAFKAARDHSII